MNSSHRKLILIGLVAALMAGWFVGWFWGGAMDRGVAARDELRSAGTELRALSHALVSGEFDRAVASARGALDEAVSAGAGPVEISALKGQVRGALKRLNRAPGLIEGLELEKRAAEEAFNAYSAWYTAYRLFSFTGQLFLNILNLLVIPLVIASLVVGVAALGDIRHVGRTGLRTVVYYMVTTSIAVIIGIAMVELISPGTGVEASGEVAGRVMGKEDVGIVDTILKVFVNQEDKNLGAFPNNIFSAMARMNILGVIVFTLFFASALTTIGEKARPVVAFFEGLNETVLKMIHWVMYMLPLGVFGLVVERLANTGGGAAVWGELTRLGYYSVTVVSGLALHAVVVLPLVLWFFTRRNPVSYASGMAQALFTAFSTASSSATLPTTMECAEVNNRVSARSASFVLPIGATINMDGTALYEAVAVIFIAQVYNVPMDATILLVVFLTATLAAVGAAGIPEAGLVTMVIVLNATGLPIEGIAVLLSIDWFLDRIRTTVNVWGDSVGAAVIDGFEARENARGG
jgi:Na+/H+-dicarboxylate symporter